MSLVLIEGFDHIGTATKFLAKGWTIIPGGNTVTFPAGRIGGFAYKTLLGGGTSGFSTANKNLPSALTGFVIGFALNVNSAPTPDVSFTEIMALRAGSTLTFRISLDVTGRLTIKNSSGTLIATGTTNLATSAWNYIEVKGVINGASGSATVHVNGVAEIAATTGNFGSTGVDNIYTQQDVNNSRVPAGSIYQYDDIYVLDTNTGSAPTNTFLGDVNVQTIFPTADGASSQWTPNSGSPHFSRVNEASATFPDDDTSYVSDSNVNDRDSYVFGDLTSTAGTVFGVQTNLYARKDDAGLRQLAAVVRRSATNYDGATATLSTSYTDYTEIRETDPSTAAAWTVSGVNAAEFGVKVVT